MRAVALTFAVLILADALTTAAGLTLGALEANPLGPVVGVAAKTVFTLPMLALIAAAEPRWRPLAAVPGAIALALPVAWNAAQLAALASSAT